MYILPREVAEASLGGSGQRAGWRVRCAVAVIIVRWGSPFVTPPEPNQCLTNAARGQCFLLGGAGRSRPSNGCSNYICLCLEGSGRPREPAKPPRRPLYPCQPHPVLARSLVSLHSWWVTCRQVGPQRASNMGGEGGAFEAPGWVLEIGPESPESSSAHLHTQQHGTVR